MSLGSKKRVFGAVWRDKTSFERVATRKIMFFS